MRIKKVIHPCETLHIPDMISDLFWGMRGLAIIVVAVVALSAWREGISLTSCHDPPDQCQR
jgi:hypothetical protein